MDYTDEDLEAMTSAEIDELVDRAKRVTAAREAEQHAKTVLQVMESEQTKNRDVVLADYHRAVEGGNLDPENPPTWVQPTGDHNAYPEHWVVSHDGSRWSSKIPANTTTPGSDPRWWENLTTPLPEPSPYEVTEWAVGVDYKVDDRVTNGSDTVYRCKMAHKSQADWAPGAPGMTAVWEVTD